MYDSGLYVQEEACGIYDSGQHVQGEECGVYACISSKGVWSMWWQVQVMNAECMTLGMCSRVVFMTVCTHQLKIAAFYPSHSLSSSGKTRAAGSPAVPAHTLTEETDPRPCLSGRLCSRYAGNHYLNK